jgi:hypothetical protein
MLGDSILFERLSIQFLKMNVNGRGYINTSLFDYVYRHAQS